MSWWQKLTMRTQDAKRDQINFPIEIELIPNKFSVQIHLQNIETVGTHIPCWTYITRGLLAHKQEEIIFSLRRGIQQKVDDFPQDPLQLFRNIYHYAHQGRLVGVGDITQLAPESFLNHTGLLYIYSEPAQKNLAKIDDVITAILLKQEELAAVNKFGSIRVMARLGQAYRHYPCPPWSDRNRPKLAFARSMEESMLTKLPRIWVKGMVSEKHHSIVMSLFPSEQKEFRNNSEYLSADKPLAFFPQFDPSARGCLVWEAGQSQPVMIAPPGSSNRGDRYICGCFVLFLQNQAENAVKLVEDGWCILLTNAAWRELQQALLTGGSFSFPTTDKSIGFKLEWIQTSYQSPIDGTVYTTEGGWQRHKPDNFDSGPRKKGSVTTQQIILLTSNPDVKERVENFEQLLLYTKTIQETVEGHFISFPLKDNQELMTQFEIWPNGKFEVRLASRPGIDNPILKQLYKALTAITPPNVKHDSIKFQIQFAISGS